MHAAAASLMILLAAFSQAKKEKPAPSTEPRAPFTINGKKLTADKVRLGSKAYLPALIEKPTPAVIGKLAKAEGIWRGVISEEFCTGHMEIPAKVQGRKNETVILSYDHLGAVKLREDVRITVYGPIDEGGYIDVWLMDVAPPGLQWACQLRNPGQIVAGQDQTFVVDVVIKNTGQQAFASVSGAVRLWQRESPNDVVEEIKIERLLPGESRTIEVPITIFNYQFIGKTSLPMCAMAITSFE